MAVVNWKKTLILWRSKKCDDNNNNREGEDPKCLLTLYRPDNAIERKYQISAPMIDSNNLCELCETQLDEFVGIEANFEKKEGIPKNGGYFCLNSDRIKGITLLQSGNVENAIKTFEEILSRDLQDPVRHFDHSWGLFENMNYDQASKGFKNVITLVRRRNRFQKSEELPIPLEGQYIHETFLLYAAYTALGRAYRAANRLDRATAAFTLALKIFRPSQNENLMDWDIFGVGNSETYLSQLLKGEGGHQSYPAGVAGGGGNQSQVVLDIEDFLQDYSMSSIDSSFNFNCTMCGECCRTSDKILLTPLDIFLLTRSPALRFLGLATTTGLLAHSRFEGVFHYTKKDEFPVCYLRPVKEESHCRFAYPLFTRDSSNISLLTSRELVPFEESDGLTSQGLEAATRTGDWIPVINKSGRQSLGCMLGVSSMPTLCASYPIAPELSQVDFWHVRRVFWRNLRQQHPLPSSNSTLSSPTEAHSPAITTNTNTNTNTNINTRMASGWQTEENYVILRNNRCEGFEDPGANSSCCLTSPAPTSKPPHPHPHPHPHPRTIRSFLSPTGEEDYPASVQEEFKSTIDRWEESQWFFALIEEISTFLPPERIQSKSIQLALLNRLALIWYNFDSLSSSQSRPIKSYRRLKKDIEILTWTLMRETKKFLESTPSYQHKEEGEEEQEQGEEQGEGESSLLSSYQNLLQRLQIY